MFDKFLKMPQVINNPGFSIWHCCICKRYREFWIRLIITPYTSILPEYSSMSFNMPQYGWILFNVLEYDWINYSDYVWVFNKPQYSFITFLWILTNVIMIELEHKNNESYSKLLTNFSFWLQWRQSFWRI